MSLTAIGLILKKFAENSRPCKFYSTPIYEAAPIRRIKFEAAHMNRSIQWNLDALFRRLMAAVIMMAAVLILCPLLRGITCCGLSTAIPVIQFYAGLASIILSSGLLLIALIFTRHAFFEFFIICAMGLIAGILSVL